MRKDKTTIRTGRPRVPDRRRLVRVIGDAPVRDDGDD